MPAIHSKMPVGAPRCDSGAHAAKSRSGVVVQRIAGAGGGRRLLPRGQRLRGSYSATRNLIAEESDAMLGDMQKRYPVVLSDAQRDALSRLIGAGSTPARKLPKRRMQPRSRFRTVSGAPPIA